MDRGGAGSKERARAKRLAETQRKRQTELDGYLKAKARRLIEIGLDSDEKIAAMLGVSVGWVKQQRSHLRSRIEARGEMP